MPSGAMRAGLLVLAVAIGGCGKKAEGGAAQAAVVPSPREEFEQAAKAIFSNPGGQLNRTMSANLRRSLDAKKIAPENEFQARLDLVNALLREAATDEAVKACEAAFERMRLTAMLEKEPAPHFVRGLAYLRQAEVANCINRHNQDCCVFPLRGGGIHVDKVPAENAAASFLETLRCKPDDLASRWLLNVCHMAMGTWPDGVPKQFLISDSVPNQSRDFPRWREISVSCGFDRLNHAGGSVADDIDGDGLIDIVLSSCNPEVSLAWYRNRGDGTFENKATKESGLADQLGGLNLVSTDYDNDGDIDLFVTRGGWMGEDGLVRNSLLRNEGDGTFTDVTRAAGIAAPKGPTQASVWFDYDNDGDLDVFIGNESRLDPRFQGTWGPADYPSNLFRNDGGRFTDVAKQAGVTNDRYCKGVTAGDYDNDGWVDLYLSNIGFNRLYRNNKDGTFTDVAEKLGVTEPSKRSFAPWFFDYDNDGDLDIWCGAYDATVVDLAAYSLGQTWKASPPRLYRNKGDGTFEDVTRSSELWRPLAPMGANFGDLDNDGWLDMYLATGEPGYEALMPNVMLKNVSGRHFVDVTVAGGFGNLQKGHGVAFVDLDNDGDQDVFNETGGFFQGDVFFNSLYENPGNTNRSVTLKLIGTQSNRLAYGARIKVLVRTAAGERAIHRAVGSVSSFGGSPSRQEIGIGDAVEIRSVEVWWPKSGIRQTFQGLEPGGFYEITEGNDAPKKLAPRRITLGRA